MKVTKDQMDFGYAWTSDLTGGALKPPAIPDVVGNIVTIEHAISEREKSLEGSSFYAESLFVGSVRVVHPRIPQVLWALKDAGGLIVRLEGEEAIMEAIYTNNEQCAEFGVPYFGAGRLIVAADALLRSKAGGYDSTHTEYLQLFGGQTLDLIRTEEDTIGPGWWRLASVY